VTIAASGREHRGVGDADVFSWNELPELLAAEDLFESGMSGSDPLPDVAVSDDRWSAVPSIVAGDEDEDDDFDDDEDEDDEEDDDFEDDEEDEEDDEEEEESDEEEDEDEDWDDDEDWEDEDEDEEEEEDDDD